MAITISGTTGIAGVDGSAGTPAVQGTDTNTGVFYPAADTVGVSTGGSERMRVDSSGNVGIGTSSPSYALDIRSSSLSGALGVNLTSGTTLTTAQGSTTNVDMAFVTKGVGLYTWTQGSTERARIDSSGNLLVGTTGSTVNNSNSLVANTNGNAYLIVNHINGTGSGTAYAYFGYNGTGIGTITQNGTAAVAYNTTSDYRLKENVQPLTGALARVATLKPVMYTWKSASDETGEGFIAHELAEVCPHAVTGEKDAVDADGNPVYQGIDTSFLVATLTAAIQEQQALITALTARIEALEAK